MSMIDATPQKKPSTFFTEYYGTAFVMLIAIFIGVAFFALKPIIDDIKQTNAQTVAESSVVEAERVYLTSLEGSIAAAEHISPDVLNRVTQALPVESNIPLLLVQFGSAAYTNGVKIESLSFSENKAPPTRPQPGATPTISQVSPVDITLTVRGQSYFDVKRFLADLETSLRLIDVVGITSSGGDKSISFNLQLRTYVFGSPTTPATK